MFYTTKDKQSIEAKFKDMELEVSALRRRIQWLEDTVYPQKEKLINAPWGLRKDGTPCAKPGRKAK